MVAAAMTFDSSAAGARWHAPTTAQDEAMMSTPSVCDTQQAYMNETSQKAPVSCLCVPT
jgi:hypothetical protein